MQHDQATPSHLPICFQDCDGIGDLPKLQLQAAAGLNGSSLGLQSGPPDWLAGARAAAKPCLLNWVIGKAQLAELLCGDVGPLESPLAYCNGAFFRCQIRYLKFEGGAAGVAISLKYEAAEVARVAPCYNTVPMAEKLMAVVNARWSVLLGEDGGWSTPCALGDKVCSAACSVWAWLSGFSIPGVCATVSEALLALSPVIHQGCLSIRVELNAK